MLVTSAILQSYACSGEVKTCYFYKNVKMSLAPLMCPLFLAPTGDDAHTLNRQTQRQSFTNATGLDIRLHVEFSLVP